MTILSIEKISKQFGGLQVLSDVSLKLEAGERFAIVGPNGAGKTTLFNIINGLLKPSSGKIVMESEDVTGFKSQEMWQRGITRTFQRNNLFLGLTTEENVRLSVRARQGLGRRISLPRDRLLQVDQEVQRILETVNISQRNKVLASDMAYGEQRQLELAIALAGRPKILLLDEPTAGMSPAETSDMITMLGGLSREVAFLIIEHDMDVIFALADRVMVLHFGRVLAEGTPKEIEQNRNVLDVYLGGRGESKP